MTGERWSRVGSLRFARTAVTSHVERDRAEPDGGPSRELPPSTAADRMALLGALLDAAPPEHGLHVRIEDLHGIATGSAGTARVARRTVLVTAARHGATRTRAVVGAPGEVGLTGLVPEVAELPVHRGPLPGLVRFEPSAFGELLAEFAAVALAVNGPGDVERHRRDWRGRPVAPDWFGLVDDPIALGGWPVDVEGVPSAPLRLVDRGVVVAAAADRGTAAAMGAPGNGRASRDVPGLRAYPANLVVEVPGAAHPRGTVLRVERVHYVSVVDARTGAVTATTRDRTTVVAGGRAVAEVPSVRFTVRVPELLHRVVGGVGPAEVVPLSWGGVVVRTPAVLADLSPSVPNGIGAQW